MLGVVPNTQFGPAVKIKAVDVDCRFAPAAQLVTLLDSRSLTLLNSIYSNTDLMRICNERAFIFTKLM